ncbi:MAG: YdcF family protein [Castellaniella sp.]
MELSRHLTPLLVPFNLALVLFVLGSLLFVLRRRRMAALAGLIGLGWLIAWSLPATSLLLGGQLEHRYPPVPAAELPKADAIVVLGGNIARGRHNWFEAYDANNARQRVDMAQALYEAGRASRIVLSGAALDGQMSEAQMMARILQSRGVPADDLILETHSLTTHENAIYTQQALARHDLGRILLVTSALHMPRAMAVFRKLGMDAIPAALPAQVRRPGDSRFSAWRPDSHTLFAARSIIKEYAGLLVYRLRGWV